MKGLQNAKQASTGMHSCFSNIQFKIEDSMSEGNRVAVRGFISGTQIAPFFGMPNNGKSFNISFIAIYHLNESGKITHRYVNGDDQGMAKQLGWF
jgi:predicted ester cyclase